MLAAIFRLADMIDCSYERSPDLGIVTNGSGESPTRIGRRYTSNWEIHQDYPECIYFRPMTRDNSILETVYREINNLNCQMTREHIEVLRNSRIAGPGKRIGNNPLPYRFLCGKNLLVRTTSDVFPVHPALRDISNEYFMFYLEESKKIRNPVKLLRYAIDVKASKSSFDVRYTLQGINVGRRNINGILHPVAGDTPLGLSDLGIRAWAKVKSKGRWLNRKTLSVISQSRPNARIKILQIPFRDEVMPNGKFEVDIAYRWPEMGSQRESLWWIDDLYSCSRTQRLELSVRFRGLRLDKVTGFCVNADSYITTQLKERDIKTSMAGFEWTDKDPLDRCLVVFVCRTIPK